MTRHHFKIATIMISALSAISSLYSLYPISDAHAEAKNRLGPYIRFQTGLQSGSLDAQAPFSFAWEMDLAIGFLSEYIGFDLNGGLSFSGEGYNRSDIINVDSYNSLRAEGVLYYHASIGSTSLLLGSGVGWRSLDQTSTYSYREGNLIKIMSKTERELNEEATSFLIRLGLLLQNRFTLLIDYDQFSLVEGQPSIKTIGFNIGYTY